MDGDDIENDNDVCIEDSYTFDYHENCLTSAGLIAPNNEPDIDNEFAAMYIGGLHVEVPTPTGSTQSTWEKLAIKTCPDLENYKSKYKGLADSMNFHMWLMGIIGIAGVAIALGMTIGSVGTAGPGGVAWTVIMGAIVAGLQAFKMYYKEIADAAGDAYTELCTPQYKFD